MSFDAEAKEPLVQPADVWRLPRITDIQIRRTDYQPPKRRFIESVFAQYREAIEFLIQFEGEYLLNRALSPILYVGNTPVGESEIVEDSRIRFLAFEPQRLEEGAPISIDWPGSSQEPVKTEFTYSLE